jgi:FKBP-type peptidyl-prolyl cis-trans isomerase 2
MQDNDFVLVSYSGKIRETGEEFDKSNEIPVIIGAGYILKGVEKALKDMQVGEKTTVEISPASGFGERNDKLVKLIPLAEFIKQDAKVQPGMIVSIQNMRGKVLSVSGGRVRVDFNHPLAGKTLVYDLEIKEKIEKPDEKVKAIVNIYMNVDKIKVDVVIKGKETEIILPPLINSVYKKKIADDCIKYLDLEKVKFVEVFEKPKEEVKN